MRSPLKGVRSLEANREGFSREEFSSEVDRDETLKDVGSDAGSQRGGGVGGTGSERVCAGRWSCGGDEAPSQACFNFRGITSPNCLELNS